MYKVTQIGLLLVTLTIPIYKWAFPEMVPQNRIPRSVAAIDAEQAAEQEQKAVKRDAQIAQEVYTRFGCGWENLSLLTAQYSRARHLSPRLVAAQIVVESGCRPDAVSPAGAVGLTQVDVKVWRQYPRAEMFDPDRNLNAGTAILANYIQQSGNVRDGLRHYYGISEGSSASDEYADKVLSLTKGRQ